MSLANTLALIKASTTALRRDRKLLLFPISFGAAFLLATSLMHAPRGWFPGLRALGDHYEAWVIAEQLADHPIARIQAIASLVVGYFLFHWTLAFFNAALVRAALCSLRGEPVSVREAFDFAVGRLPALAGYAVIAGTIGTVIGLLDRMPLANRVAGWAFKGGWSMLTFLAIPVLVQERRGGVAAVRRSSQLFRATWKEGTAGRIGLWLFAVPALVPLGMLALALYAVHPTLGLAALFTLGLVSLAIEALAIVLNALYASALYTFAVEGVIPTDFLDERLHDLWQVRSTH